MPVVGIAEQEQADCIFQVDEIGSSELGFYQEEPWESPQYLFLIL